MFCYWSIIFQDPYYSWLEVFWNQLHQGILFFYQIYNQIQALACYLGIFYVICYQYLLYSYFLVFCFIFNLFVKIILLNIYIDKNEPLGLLQLGLSLFGKSSDSNLTNLFVLLWIIFLWFNALTTIIWYLFFKN